MNFINKTIKNLNDSFKQLIKEYITQNQCQMIPLDVRCLIARNMIYILTAGTFSIKYVKSMSMQQRNINQHINHV